MTAARALAMADLHLGIGCDQLILIGTSDEADVRMRIFNADGSEVDACGNATRCIPLFLGRDCRIETNAGLLKAELHGEGASVDMGQPRFGWDEIPLAYPMDTLTMPASREDFPVHASAPVVHPQVIFFCEDLDAGVCGRLGEG